MLASIVLAFFVVFGFVYGLQQTRAAAPGANIIGYQGRLLNSNGVPVSDSTATVIFELYTALSGGSCVWSNSSATCASATGRSVTLTDGLFSEPLGDTAAATPYAAIGDTIFADNATLFLQVTVNGELLTPRKQILAAGYALNSQTLDGYDTTTAGTTSSKVAVFDTNGNLQITGNPQSSAVGAGSVYINPAAGVVAANEALFNIAVGAAHRFAVDAEGDVAISGDLSMGGGDLISTGASFNLLNTTVTTLTMAGATTLLDFNNAAVTSTINIGGTTQDGANTVNIATNNTSADTINIGNSNATTVVTFSGGTFDFTSAATTSDAVDMVFDSLTTGSGLEIVRADSGTDFDGSLVSISQNDAGAGVDAKALIVTNAGGGNSVGLHIAQATTSAHVANSIGNNALVIDILETPSAENAVILRSDADGAPDTEFRITTQGDVYMDGNMQSASTSVGGADYAEFFKSNDSTLTGTKLACQDETLPNGVETCAAGSGAVMGVVSTNAGIMGNTLREDFRDMLSDANYRLIGVLGQIDTLVNADEGAIAVGDPITTSAVMAGYGAKARGPVRIVGFALEPLASGSGTIRVLVQPQWYGGDVLSSDGDAVAVDGDVILAPVGDASSSVDTYASHGLVLRGSSWDGAVAAEKEMTLQTSTNASDYRLSVVNNDGAEVAYVGQSGDLALAGRLYPSDRGSLQTSKYIYYDGSSGAGGDMMRTNAGGWGSGSYDFAEMFPSIDALAAGEVVIFADSNETIRRSTGTTYDRKIAGVVSTRPGFVAGENKPGHVAVALAGRVPTYVSGENGDIAIGDPLTTSSKPGYAMKATEAGPILGYAMETFSGTTGVVTTFIRPSYFDGGPVEEAPIAENTASEVRNIATLDVSGSLNLNGSSILSVASLVGIGQTWRLEENGNFITHGRIIQLVQSYAGENVETYAATSREQTIELSGTAALVHGSARIDFERLDPSFNDIIANTVPYRVYLTPAGMTGMLAAVERTNDGFKIQEAGSTSGVAVDWMVVAYHKDFAPDPVTSDAIAPVDVEEVPIETPAEIPSESGETTIDPPADPPVEEVVVPEVEEPRQDDLVMPVVEEPSAVPGNEAQTEEQVVLEEIVEIPAEAVTTEQP